MKFSWKSRYESVTLRNDVFVDYFQHTVFFYFDFIEVVFFHHFILRLNLTVIEDLIVDKDLGVGFNIFKKVRSCFVRIINVSFLCLLDPLLRVIITFVPDISGEFPVSIGDLVESGSFLK